MQCVHHRKFEILLDFACKVLASKEKEGDCEGIERLHKAIDRAVNILASATMVDFETPCKRLKKALNREGVHDFDK